MAGTEEDNLRGESWGKDMRRTDVEGPCVDVEGRRDPKVGENATLESRRFVGGLGEFESAVDDKRLRPVGVEEMAFASPLCTPGSPSLDSGSDSGSSGSDWNGSSLSTFIAAATHKSAMLVTAFSFAISNL